MYSTMSKRISSIRIYHHFHFQYLTLPPPKKKKNFPHPRATNPAQQMYQPASPDVFFVFFASFLVAKKPVNILYAMTPTAKISEAGEYLPRFTRKTDPMQQLDPNWWQEKLFLTQPFGTMK